MSEKATDAECRLILLIADIREVVGDREGRLMQDELVEHCKALRAERDRLREEVKAANEDLDRAHERLRLQAKPDSEGG